MKKSLFILLAIFVALLATPSCKKEKGTEGPPAIEVSGVSVDKTTVGLKVGDKVKLVPTVIPDDATNKNVSYESDDNNIATVTQDGEISAVGLIYYSLGNHRRRSFQSRLQSTRKQHRPSRERNRT